LKRAVLPRKRMRPSRSFWKAMRRKIGTMAAMPKTIKTFLFPTWSERAPQKVLEKILMPAKTLKTSPTSRGEPPRSWIYRGSMLVLMPHSILRRRLVTHRP